MNTLLFQLKYQGKKSYLLPTCYALPLDILHDDIQKIITKINTLVLECNDLVFFSIPEKYIASDKLKKCSRFTAIPIHALV